MYKIGEEELQELRKVVESGQIFRYGIGNQCSRFEERFAEKLGVKHCIQTASGTNALTAALVGAGIGPGDEVIVPACTYMATPIAVIAAGAIPVIVDIDESVTLDPEAVKKTIGPKTKAVMPVHMWGLVCDLDAFMDIADEYGVSIIEDACQAVGGAYKGKMVGSIGHVGGFSFNYYKNMTCGEGGAVVTDNDDYAERVSCTVDPCSFYWKGRENTFRGFVYDGARASEFEGAILNIQLDRIDDMIDSMRRQKQLILERTADTGLDPIPAHSIEWECGTHVMYRLPTAKQADDFAEKTNGTVALKTGRHVYTEWDPILDHLGAHHPALNPYNLPENRECRKDYDPDMCQKSLDILDKTVFIQTHPDNSDTDVNTLVDKIKKAAEEVMVAGAPV